MMVQAERRGYSKPDGEVERLFEIRWRDIFFIIRQGKLVVPYQN
jgi:hypothetical protein